MPMSNKPCRTVGAASSRRRGFNRAYSVTTVRAVGTLTAPETAAAWTVDRSGRAHSRTNRATCPAPLPAAKVGACSATHPAVDPACDAEISPRDSASPTTATRAPHTTAARASSSLNKVPNSAPWTCHNDATNSVTVFVAARISARRDAESRVAAMLSITPTLAATTDRPPTPKDLSHRRIHHKRVSIGDPFRRSTKGLANLLKGLLRCYRESHREPGLATLITAQTTGRRGASTLTSPPSSRRANTPGCGRHTSSAVTSRRPRMSCRPLSSNWPGTGTG